jgi:hypothetical protein
MSSSIPPAEDAKSAEELAKVLEVHAVLDSEVPKETLHPDVDQAIEQTDQLKDKLKSAEEKLKTVNEALEQQLAPKGS